jgi:hypothetical protein
VGNAWWLLPALHRAVIDGMTVKCSVCGRECGGSKERKVHMLRAERTDVPHWFVASHPGISTEDKQYLILKYKCTAHA